MNPSNGKIKNIDITEGENLYPINVTDPEKLVTNSGSIRRFEIEIDVRSYDEWGNPVSPGTIFENNKNLEYIGTLITYTELDISNLAKQSPKLKHVEVKKVKSIFG